MNISLRINEALLADLRAAATESGHNNLSREIMNRLRASLVAQGHHNEEMLGIAYVMERALNILPGGKLRNDPWRMVAFTAATSAILERLAPEGEPIPPRDYGQLRDVPNVKEAHPWTIGVTVGSLAYSVLQSLPADQDYVAQVRSSLDVSFQPKKQTKDKSGADND